MDNQAELTEEATIETHPQIALINTFCEITTCPSKSEALFFLESHNFDLDAAVSTFLDDTNPPAVFNSAAATEGSPNSTAAQSHSPLSAPSDDDEVSPVYRSRSPSPTRSSYNLRPSRRSRNSAGQRLGGVGGRGGIRTLADLNQNVNGDGSDSDPDFDPQEHYTGGEKSGMVVQDPSRGNDVDAIFTHARESGAVVEPSTLMRPSSSTSFSGNARLLSGADPAPSTPQPHEQAATRTITLWRNGFTVDDGPLRRFDDPANSSFLQSLRHSECPEEFRPANKETTVGIVLKRKEEDYKERKTSKRPFRGTGRTLGSSTSNEPMLDTVSTTLQVVDPNPSSDMVIDEAQPCTSIQIRLSDGTRVVSRFNMVHTIGDIRNFIDGSMGNNSRENYQLQSMGFPPKQLTDLGQTIEEAGIANSVVIQKF